ncbi:uncharacterized protein LOC100199111 [Hydra vulgaris]|uniref:Uncharacterized protein LOC100199111 n=1 Tax=Hydra vulgaris TaxID=6087 RepID=A0ABM4BIE2_HYDVU
MEELKKKLIVKVINGRGLKNKETFQTSDPYCLVEVGSQKQKTKHVSSNLNPDWGDEFVFDLTEDEVKVLSVSVWDKNTLKKDVFMGYTFVTFDDCKSMVETVKTVNMMGGLTGQITVSLKPEFETSASKIERLDKQIIEIKISHDQSDNKNLEKELNEKLAHLSSENAELINQNKALLEKCKEFEKTNVQSSELAKLTIECQSLREQCTNQASENSQLNTTIVELKGQIHNFRNIFEELLIENQKLIRIRDGLNNLCV